MNKQKGVRDFYKFKKKNKIEKIFNGERFKQQREFRNGVIFLRKKI